MKSDCTSLASPPATPIWAKHNLWHTTTLLLRRPCYKQELHSYSLARASSCSLYWPASTYNPAFSQPDCGYHQLVRKSSEKNKGRAETENQDWGQSQPRHAGRVTAPSQQMPAKRVREKPAAGAGTRLSFNLLQRSNMRLYLPLWYRPTKNQQSDYKQTKHPACLAHSRYKPSETDHFCETVTSKSQIWKQTSPGCFTFLWSRSLNAMFVSLAKKIHSNRLST